MDNDQIVFTCKCGRTYSVLDRCDRFDAKNHGCEVEEIMDFQLAEKFCRKFIPNFDCYTNAIQGFLIGCSIVEMSAENQIDVEEFMTIFESMDNTRKYVWNQIKMHQVWGLEK